ncbi:MAG: MMPL family transporter [Thermoleophilia bacterium]|nr:MMPL family transporter [Thermoleophilia bacterium]
MRSSITGRLYRLAKFCIRHRKTVVSFWLVLAVAIVLFGNSAGTQFADNLSLPGTGSQAATDLVAEDFPGQANGTNPIVYKARQGKITDSGNQSLVEQSIKKLSDTSGVTSVNDPFSPGNEAQIGKAETIAYASLIIDDSRGELSDEDANRIIDAAASTAGSKLDVAAGGYLGQQVSKPSTRLSEVVGLAAAAVVLLLTFGSVVAMGMPLISAVTGLMISLSLIGLLSQVTTISTTSPTLATMIGLGVGIDYALFVVTRHRLAMHSGNDPPEAAARAAATAGGAVVFAGSTVVVALLSLGLAGIPLVWTLGYSAAIAVLVAMLAAITFLPALLALIGPRIEHLRVPLPHSTAPDTRAHGWERWAEGVARRPLPAVIITSLVLLLIAMPARNLHLGQEDLGALPKSTETRRAYDLITEGFGVGENGPLLIATDLNGDSATPDKLAQDISGAEGVEAVSPPQIDKNGNAAIFNAIPTTAPSSRTTEHTVARLRDKTIPDALKGSESVAYVGGSTAGYIDLADEIGNRLPYVIGLVVLFSFLVLTLAFRSLLIPLQAALMNLLSIGAAYGLVTLVFQEGWGAGLIGLDGPIPIVSYLPLVMFAILFGLSMDYEVFLLSQIREAHHKSGDNRESVIKGLASSGRVITSAALIMVAVFLSFVLNGDPVVKQFGVGLAFAVAIDATMVRCLLVPATLVLVGRRNWELPGWLERVLPRVDIEGDEYFEKLARKE